MNENNKPVRTNPKLWEECKHEAVSSMGKFSARAMQRAVVLYKQRGGGYEGEKSPRNALVKWSNDEKKKKQFLNGEIGE